MRAFEAVIDPSPPKKIRLHLGLQLLSDNFSQVEQDNAKNVFEWPVPF